MTWITLRPDGCTSASASVRRSDCTNTARRSGDNAGSVGLYTTRAGKYGQDLVLLESARSGTIHHLRSCCGMFAYQTFRFFYSFDTSTCGLRSAALTSPQSAETPLDRPALKHLGTAHD